MQYRLDKESLLEHLSQWNTFLKRKVRLIACGGTAMTLLGVKASTRDVDLMVPVIKEYEYLLRTLQALGYKSKSGWGWGRDDEPYVFDLFRGKSIHTTELLEDPLKEGNHVPIKKWTRIELGVLNDYDLIVSKLFRGTQVDFDDCLALAAARQGGVDLKKLKEHFFELLNFHTVGEERVRGNWDIFERRLKGVK